MKLLKLSLSLLLLSIVAACSTSPSTDVGVVAPTDSLGSSTTSTSVDLSWLNTTTTTQVVPVKPSTPRPPSSHDAGKEVDGATWDALAACECGGNWGCNTGNGFGGGLQFMHQSSYSSWLSYGGGEFAAHPWEASREQQIVVGQRIHSSVGFKAWPGCSRKLGLI